MVIKFPFEFLTCCLPGFSMSSCSRTSFGSVLYYSGPQEKKLRHLGVVTHAGAKGCKLDLTVVLVCSL